MKKCKKLLTLVSAMAIVLGLFLATGSLQLSAETANGWLEFVPQEMEHHFTSDWVSWSADSAEDGGNTGAECAFAWNSCFINEKGGRAPIVMYKVPETARANSTIVIQNTVGSHVAGPTAGEGIYVNSSGQSAKFAITDKTGKILWPTDGVPATIGTTKTNIDVTLKVNPGDELYFISFNPSVNSLALYAYFMVELNGGIVNYRYGRMLGPTDGGRGAFQGDDNWYYLYADSVEYSNVDPNGYTDEGKGEYTVDYGETLTPMHKISTSDGDPNNGWLGDNRFRDTVFVGGQNAYFSTNNDALIARYTAPVDGDFKIGYAGVALKAMNYNAWPEGTGVEFCMVDHTGKVVYPENGAPVKLTGDVNDPFNESTAVAFYKSNMKAGETLDFVFKPYGEDRPYDYNWIVTVNGSFTLNGSRIDSSGRLMLNHDEKQGSRNITLFTSSDLSINKVADGEWTEFVQLENALTAAPATVEAWVKVPAEMPDWKVGTLLSDGNYTVQVDTFGHPRFVSGNVDWTVGNVDLRTGEWQHVAFTVDGNTATFYQNGVAVATTALTDAALAISGQAPVIGNTPLYASTTAFYGAMKKVALYGDVRTADEIAADMRAVSTSADNLMHYWVLNGVYTDKVGDNDGAMTQVNSSWYEDGRPADAAEGEYTIVHVGDNQVVTDFFNDGYQVITQWIADNAERLNIQMVLNSGDLVNYANYASGDTTNGQWQDAVAGMNVLKNAGVPYVFAPGNHEYPDSGGKKRTSYEFNDHFKIEEHLVQGAGQANETKLIYAYPGTQRIDSKADLTLLENNTTGVTVYGDTYVEGMESAFYLATLGGKQYILLALEVQPRFAVTEWASAILKQLEDEFAEAGTEVTTIVVTHDYLSERGHLETGKSCFNKEEQAISNSASSLYTDFISRFESIQLVFCGHVATGMATRTDIGVNGNKITTIMNDQSYEGNGGEGNILLLRCKADGTVIKAEYYSPILEKYYVPQYQFDFDTKADSDDLKIQLPTFTELTYGRGDGVWFETSTYQGAYYVAWNSFHTYASERTVALSRSYEAPVSGRMKYTISVTSNTAVQTKFKYTLCREDGTVLYPTNGDLWKEMAANETGNKSVTFDVTAGEKIHLILTTIDSEGVTGTAYFQSGGTITPADGSEAITFHSNQVQTNNKVQGDKGWYFYRLSRTSLGIAQDIHTVTYGVDGEGGTLSCGTGGTAANGVCTVAAGGTARFTASPKDGYRIVGYYVDGEYYKSTKRILCLPMIKEDMDVKVVFEKIPLVGDANGDGVVDVLDAVHLKRGVEAEAPIVNETVCDLVDEIDAKVGIDVLDAADIGALRKKLLG